jgi:hypothetical protein
MNVAVASVKTYNKKSIKHEYGRSLRQNSWQEVDFYNMNVAVATVCLIEKFTFWILWHVASKLIRKKKAT